MLFDIVTKHKIYKFGLIHSPFVDNFEPVRLESTLPPREETSYKKAIGQGTNIGGKRLGLNEYGTNVERPKCINSPRHITKGSRFVYCRTM